VLDVAADRTEALGGSMRLVLAQIAQGKGKAPLAATNRKFVTLPCARPSYAGLIGLIGLIGLMIALDGPVVNHCTAGKVCTGWATAVVLTLLGVPREALMQDYLLRNQRHAAKNGAILAELARSRSTVALAFLTPVLTVRPAYIEAALPRWTTPTPNKALA
jgi:protein-tyrosine phosphatase